jgi:hypothetical protein
MRLETLLDIAVHDSNLYLHLLSLEPSTGIAKVIRWIATPTTFSVNELLNPRSPWHLFLLLPSDGLGLPSNLQSLLSARWSIQTGVPSRLLQNFPPKSTNSSTHDRAPPRR